MQCRDIFVTAIVSSLSASVLAQTFEGLGDLPGGLVGSAAFDVSADGSVVVGRSFSAASGESLEAFRWTVESGMTGLGDLDTGQAGDAFWSSAYAVSGDGRVVVGASESVASLSRLFKSYEGFFWTAETGMVGLGVIDNNLHQGSPARAASFDGTVICGKAAIGNGHLGYLWTADTGLTTYGPLIQMANGALRGVCADGSIVVGRDMGIGSGFTQYCPRPVRIGPDRSLTVIEDICAEAHAVSDDGRIVLGQVRAGRHHVVRWIDGVRIPVPEPEGADFVWTKPVTFSGDGLVVLAAGRTRSNDTVPFVWDAWRGARLLDHVTHVEYGVATDNWDLVKANSLSSDGTTIVGDGMNPAGDIEAWRLVLPDLPCPVDFNRDGSLDTLDLIDMLNAYTGLDQRADFNHDGSVSILDVVAYLSSYIDGCSRRPPASAVEPGG